MISYTSSISKQTFCDSWTTEGNVISVCDRQEMHNSFYWRVTWNCLRSWQISGGFVLSSQILINCLITPNPLSSLRLTLQSDEFNTDILYHKFIEDLDSRLWIFLKYIHRRRSRRKALILHLFPFKQWTEFISSPYKSSKDWMRINWNGLK